MAAGLDGEKADSNAGESGEDSRGGRLGEAVSGWYQA